MQFWLPVPDPTRVSTCTRTRTRGYGYTRDFTRIQAVEPGIFFFGEGAALLRIVGPKFKAEGSERGGCFWGGGIEALLTS